MENVLIDGQTCSEGIPESRIYRRSSPLLDRPRNVVRGDNFANFGEFLGWNSQKYAGKLLIKPSEKFIKETTWEFCTTIQLCEPVSRDKLIQLINLIIVGWTNYHSHVVSSEIFHKLDNTLYHMLRHWASQRHFQKAVYSKLRKYAVSRNGFLSSIGKRC